MTEKLKTAQERAIEKVSGPCLITAGAGTGKTYTIVEKIAYLIDKEICSPEEILCLTFSREATNNLNDKVRERVKKTSGINIRTFHGFCADVLKEYGYMVDVDPSFEILLPEDAKVWFYNDLGISPYYGSLYFSTISAIKDFGISPGQIEEYAAKLRESLGATENLEKHAGELEFELNTLHLYPSETKDERREIRERKKEINNFLKDYYEYKKYRDFIDAWKRYEALKNDRNVQDYADLNFNVIKLFERFGADMVSGEYGYFIVDEFQDTNKLQFDLIEKIAEKSRNITVVGDKNQSIYGFRGAYKENFEHFRESFKINDSTDVFELDKSYRSPNTVLRVAHRLIQNNYENPNECLIVENAAGREGDKVNAVELKNYSEEARKVAEITEDELLRGVEPKEICVLYRTHQQGKMLKIALDAKGIPTIAAGSTNLMQKPEIKTIISYLSVLNNLISRTGTGEQAWWGLFHFHNSLTPQDSVRIGRYLKNNRSGDISIDDALLNSIDAVGISESGKIIVKRVVLKLKELMEKSNKNLPDLILDIYEITGLNRAFTHTRSIRNTESLMNLKRFHEISENYCKTHGESLDSFIHYLEILETVGVNFEASEVENVDAVRVMTMHAVKGLQFRTVIVTNLAEKRFPLERTAKEPLIPKELNPDIKRHLSSLGKPSAEEKNDAIKNYERESLLYEERRLCYVSFTRAKEKLFLTFSRSYNKDEDSSAPSQFLEEIDFRDNKDILVTEDKEEKGTVFAPCSRREQFRSMLKSQLIESLDSEDFNSILSRLATYYAVREGKLINYPRIVDWDNLIDAEYIKDRLNAEVSEKSGLTFDADSFTFSPSALLEYDECPKKYELSHIFRMPQRGAFELTAAETGTFVHEVLEKGVKKCFKTSGEFKSLAHEISKLPQYEGVNLEDVNRMIDVFWERNKGKYDEKSKVESWVNVTLGGFRFNGKIDRIDFLTNKDVEIIDYKTNKQAIPPKHRSWQLGFYALAVKNQMGLNPVRLTLEMLMLEKPFEAEVDDKGIVTSGSCKSFNLAEVGKELIECAEKIKKDYETGFLPSKDDTPCRFCGYKFYCPKWEDAA